jgi:hypothetical protein
MARFVLAVNDMTQIAKIEDAAGGREAVNKNPDHLNPAPV